MSDIFPKWTNRLPRNIIIGALLVSTALTAGVTYYFTPKYTRMGYQPIQPVAFPHSVHVTQLGMDCRYCHNGVEKSWYSNIPATSVCMNCHNQVLKDDDRLALVRESAASGKPIPWVQIHKLPDYAYFNHSVHVNRGVSCVECHGQINHMDEVYHATPLSMSFCLNCHRDPAAHLRPLDKITDLDWHPPGLDARARADNQRQMGEKFVHDWKVQSLQSCSTCHR
jgi:formate-dependent nitrite reductase cytochrome c552 subunit